jgi:hypothetical protein
MSKMQHKQMAVDLEYLAGMGFESVPVSEADLADLNRMVKSRLRPDADIYTLYSGGMMVLFLCLTFMMMSYNSPPSLKSESPKSKPEPVSSPEEINEVLLDTLVFTENFVSRSRLALKSPVKEIPENKIESLTGDTIITLEPAKTMPLPVREEKQSARYVANAPFIFLHDLKVTDYQRLYFSGRKSLELPSVNGVPASRAEKVAGEENFLERNEGYYLHQAIADAMLQFRKKEYKACLYTLNQVALVSGKDDINCRFYTAMCYYHLRYYSAASKEFDACIDHSNNTFLPEAEFYKALSLFESGSKEEASLLLKKIVLDNGYYAERAQEILALN